MIARLKGTIEEKGRDFLVVDVNGVGYHVFVSGSILASTGAIGAEIALRIFTYVREDTLQLFGFLSAAEQTTFEKLLSVSGIGPKMALSFLTQFSPDDLSDAVARRDAAALARVRGVGRRTADRLILELQGKLGAATPGFGGSPTPAAASADEAAAALIAFGYTPVEAEAALAGVPPATALSAEERVMLALRQLDRLRG